MFEVGSYCRTKGDNPEIPIYCLCKIIEKRRKTIVIEDLKTNRTYSVTEYDLNPIDYRKLPHEYKSTTKKLTKDGSPLTSEKNKQLFDRRSSLTYDRHIVDHDEWVIDLLKAELELAKVRWSDDSHTDYASVSQLYKYMNETAQKKQEALERAINKLIAK